MDLHVSSARETAAERAAIDAALGPHALGEAATHSTIAGGLAEASQHRHHLLPALLAVQDRIGWVSEGALNAICRRLTIAPAEAFGVASFYGLLATTPRPPRVAHVCDDIACQLAGAPALCAELERSLGPAGAPGLNGNATWLRSPCLGHCERAPAVFFQLAGDEEHVTCAPCDALTVMDVLGGQTPRPTHTSSTPQTAAGRDDLRLLRRIDRIDPRSLADYRANGGYEALRLAIDMGPEAVVSSLIDSKLQGRGGAAFPAGRKWQAVARAAARPHYVVCNADESEPGTFKDRVLMEQDPFSVVEALTIAGLAVGAERGYVYVRGEYPLAARRLQDAMTAARAAGLLGHGVAGAGTRFDIELRRGAGAYICGEETALFNSIEGYRGEPRNKPPYPTESGLFGKPTVVNNVETLVNVLEIVSDGAERYARVGTTQSTGPKLFCMSGAVVRPGLYEAAFGATLGEMIGLAGGVRPGRTLRTILLGGAAGSFIGPEHLDVPLTFEGTRAIGASIGSGVVMVFDDRADMPTIVRRIAAFFRDESCGQCVPCRVGTVRQEEVLARIARLGGAPANGTSALLADLAQVMRDASICGLGHTAATAVQSALAHGLLVRSPAEGLDD